MLSFNVIGQTLTRSDHFAPASDSVEYLTATFNFPDATGWANTLRTALFRRGDKSYKALLSGSNSCRVPTEVLVGDDNRLARIKGNTFYVSLLGENGTYRVTTNEIAIKFNRSGFADADTPADPTATEYTQITEIVANAITACENAVSECETACENAVDECTAKRNELSDIPNIFANGITKNVYGKSVKLTDIAQHGQSAVVKFKSKNLLPNTYIGNTVTAYGGTITALSDGGCQLSGTVTGGLVMTLYSGVPLTDKPITCSLQGEYQYASMEITLHDSAGDVLGYWEAKNGVSRTIDVYAYHGVAKMTIGIKRSVNDVELSGVAYPMVEIGTEASEYVPYEDGAVNMTVCGKNLIPLFNSGATTIARGVTYNCRANGSMITLSGTADGVGGRNNFSTQAGRFNLIKGVTYTLSAALVWGTCESCNVYINNSDDDSVYQGCKMNGSVTFTADEDRTCYIGINTVEGVTYNNARIRFQLEIGSEVTDYEVYNTATAVVSSQVGRKPIKVGVIGGTMTMQTDNENAVVDVTYIKDTNKVISKIADALGITI